VRTRPDEFMEVGGNRVLSLSSSPPRGGYVFNGISVRQLVCQFVSFLKFAMNAEKEKNGKGSGFI